MKPIPLQVPWLDERELDAVRAVLASGRIGGGGPLLERVEARLRARLGARHALVTTSCTHAFEIAALAHAIGAGDEVVVPTYTHPGTASAFLRNGADVVFADSSARSPQLDPADVARRVTPRTRAVVAVHYGGVPSAVDELAELCRERGVLLLEDAAQAFDARHRGRACGTLGACGAISFHETKNVVCGEGGVLLTDDDELAAKARVARESGTDRADFRAGRIDRYAWQGLGSSLVPSEIAMAVLDAQLDKADEILARRRRMFGRYLDLLADAERAGRVDLPVVPAGAEPNGHVFHVLMHSREARDALAAALTRHEIGCATHFEPLDDSPFGRRLRRGGAPLPNARRIADTLLRLPLHPALTDAEQDRVVEVLCETIA